MASRKLYDADYISVKSYWGGVKRVGVEMQAVEDALIGIALALLHMKWVSKRKRRFKR